MERALHMDMGGSPCQVQLVLHVGSINKYLLLLTLGFKPHASLLSLEYQVLEPGSVMSFYARLQVQYLVSKSG